MHKHLLPRHAAYRLLLLLLANLVLLLALAAVIWLDNGVNRGITYTPDPTPIPWANQVEPGVNVYNLHLEPDPTVVTQTLELVRDLGVRYVRMQVPWEDIEIHGRGDFQDRRNIEAVGVISSWQKYDHIVDTADRLGLELVMRIDRAPMWASQFFKNLEPFQEGLQIDPNSTGPPDDFNDFYNFVYTVAERYRGKVNFIQIWNEPNLLNEWNWQTPNPRDFVTLQCLGYMAAKDANPDAVVLFPSLAPTDGLDKRAPLSDLEFLDRFYQEGGGDCFDILSAQAYGLGQPPDEHRYVRLRDTANWNWRRPIDTRTDVSRVVLLHEVMQRHDDADKAIWIGEFGWNSAPDSIPPERRYTWGPPVSEAQKADYIIGQIERAKREWPWMGVMHIWMLRYGGYLEPDPHDPTPYFALVERDWTLLPAYTRLQDYLAQPVVAGVGAHTWQHPAVERIAGGWRLRYAGTHVTLIGGLDGDLEATLNGQPITLVAHTIDGQSALSTPPGMADTAHTLDILTTATTPPERFVVARDPPWPWFWTLAPAMLIGLLLLSGALTMQALFATLDALLTRSSLGRMGPRAWLAAPQGERVVLPILLLGMIIFYRASPELPLTLVGLLLFGAAALLRPDLALLGVPLTVLLFFMPKGIWDERFGIRAEGVSIPLHEVLLLIVVGATLTHWLWKIRKKRAAAIASLLPRLHPVALLRQPVIFFVLAGTLGVLIVPPEGRGSALREWRWLIVEPLLFYALLRYYLHAPPDHKRTPRHDFPLWLVSTFILGGAIVGLIGILQFFGFNLAPLIGDKVGFSDDSILVEGVRRVNSVYGHPNNLGLYMGRVWPIAAVLTAQSAKRKAQSAGVWPGWFGVFAGLCTLLCLGGLVVSFSKGALLGAVGAAVMLLVMLRPVAWRPGKRLLISLTALVIVSVLIAISIGVERFNLLGETTGIRLKTWTSALAMLSDHALFGIGLDQFGRLYPDYIHPSLIGSNEINTSHPHNLVLDTWLRMGIAGLLVFGWLLTRFFRSIIARWRTSPKPANNTLHTYLLAGITAAMVAALIHGMVDNFYFVPDLAYAFWLMIALANSVSITQSLGSPSRLATEISSSIAAQ